MCSPLAQVAQSLYSLFQLVLLPSAVAFARSQGTEPPLLTYVEAAAGFLGGLALLWLSCLAHWRSIEPSRLVIAYLLAKFACYTVSATAPGVPHDDSLEFTQGCLIIPLLLLEIRGKRSILLAAYQSESPEATTSFLGRVLFTWVNPILYSGYTKILHEGDLPPLEQKLDSNVLIRAILQAWDQRGSCLFQLACQVFRDSEMYC